MRTGEIVNEYFGSEPFNQKYGDFTAVNNLDFNVVEGEIFDFSPNGAGKTTTINMLTGLARVTSGSVYLSGIDYTRDTKRLSGSWVLFPMKATFMKKWTGFII